MAGLRELASSLLDRRRLVVLTVLLGWAVVIGAGAGADPATTSWLGIPALGDLLVLLVGLMSLVGFVLLVAVVLSMRRGETDLPARRPLWPSLVVMALLLAIALRLPRPDDSTGRVEQPAPTVDEAASPVVRSVVVGRNELVALLAIAAIAIATVIWTRRRLAALHPDGDDRSLAAALQPVIAGATRRLQQHDDDPRSAVIAAYATLEGALTELGLGRGRAETPAEHIERILAGLAVDQTPVVALAELYSLARFSDHPITATDRRRAAAALGAVDDDLRALDVVPAGDAIP